METFSIILAVLVVILAIVVISAGVKVVPQSETRVVERLGRFHSVLAPGLNFIVPFIDRPKTIYTRRIENSIGNRTIVKTVATSIIDLREQVYDFPAQQVITRDNVTTEINALLYFQITDPKKAVYEIDNLPNAIEKLTQTSLRNVIGELELDETLSSRDTINSRLQNILDDATNKWGVKVNRVELQDITPPESVREAMEKQMQAERNRRAEILNAEGEKQSLILRSEGEKTSKINQAEAVKEAEILRAEGEAKAIILNAEAEAEAIRRVAEAVAASKTDPATYMLAMKYIETLKEMTSGKDGKTVYIPYEASSVLSSIGSIKSLFQQK
ncbi:SPFH domain-containing protein [Lepagella muris]|jgi:regulator of protease activity HflC (stomatin/prohibitin superfamily)|uniref:SPFH/Band 7/PHB domain protein n=1 Tax=Lepagella muris TaxID=3032870 RepID=A0AC61RD78_9BACT|nr:SPFH domain-containing protein [Lepagella muris]ROT03422.1 SPFH/Band 7/PHB domain protein [Muribaculaceae bacterium Isolate-037 (Harlan)]TGY77508.1 SPFH/Band 7/PHB domain protein [Lepagella muris]THG50089.1 SPFH/Band 7/PHB domain protein [Bacteroidales bacterium]TKC60427.1 SPFH/Band 7/PHB domain protein [Bacteroidales bacterium]